MLFVQVSLFEQIFSFYLFGQLPYQSKSAGYIRQTNKSQKQNRHP